MMLPNISYTFLSTYKRCRKRCQLELIKRVVPLEAVDNRPFIVGRVADWLFTKWITENNYREGWMVNKAEDLFNWFAKKFHIVYKGKDDKAKLIFKLKNAVTRLEACALSENLPDRNLTLQKRFEKTKNGLNFVGKVDIWMPDEKIVWDLKITESSKWLDKFQLMFFAWLMSMIGHEVGTVGFFAPLMKRKYLQEHTVYPLDLDETERQTFELIGMMKEGNWQATSTDCWGCPVQDYCEEDVKIDRMTPKKSGGFTIDVGDVS